MHRDHDRPAAIYFDDVGRPTMWTWHRNGKLHRDGDKPAEIGFFDGSLEALAGIGFFKDGVPTRNGGGEPTFEFDLDGTAYSSDGEIVHFDGFQECWLPNPVPNLNILQPFFLPSPNAKP